MAIGLFGFEPNVAASIGSRPAPAIGPSLPIFGKPTSAPSGSDSKSDK